MERIETKVQEKKEGGEWAVSLNMPSMMAEAVELYGEDAVFALFTAQLKIKMQAVARENFKAGKSREEVETILDEFKPGRSGKTSLKNRALVALTENADKILADASLKSKVMAAFSGNNYKEVLVLLGIVVADDEDGENEE